MADSEREDLLGFNDIRRVQGQVTTVVSSVVTYVDVSAMRTQLATDNPTYFTTARLNQMTKNDMVYALRQGHDLVGIK